MLPLYRIAILIVLLVIGTVIVIMNGSNRAKKDQSLLSKKGKLEEVEGGEEANLPRLHGAIVGSAGGFVGSVIALVYVLSSGGIQSSGLEVIAIGLALAGITLGAIPIGLIVVGPLAGVITVALFNNRSIWGAFSSGLLVQLIIEIPILWLLLSS